MSQLSRLAGKGWSVFRLFKYMTLLQSKVDDEKDETKEGNIFNEKRDNCGKGIKIGDLIAVL